METVYNVTKFCTFFDVAVGATFIRGSCVISLFHPSTDAWFLVPNRTLLAVLCGQTTSHVLFLSEHIRLQNLASGPGSGLPFRQVDRGGARRL